MFPFSCDEWGFPFSALSGTRLEQHSSNILVGASCTGLEGLPIHLGISLANLGVFYAYHGIPGTKLEVPTI